MISTLVVLIWDLDPENVYTRIVEVDKDTEPLKVNGKKANKLIVPESCKDTKLLRKIKSLGVYRCKMITAIGK